MSVGSIAGWFVSIILAIIIIFNIDGEPWWVSPVIAFVFAIAGAYVGDSIEEAVL